MSYSPTDVVTVKDIVTLVLTFSYAVDMDTTPNDAVEEITLTPVEGSMVTPLYDGLIEYVALHHQIDPL